MTPTSPTLTHPTYIPSDALDRARSFAHRFGTPHVALALHAAIPLGLTPELLNLIRVNFLRNEVPWFAEADLLLSPLCRDLGDGYYQMDPEIRDLLLEELRDFPAFGENRLRAIAGLLFVWARQGSQTDEEDRAFRLAQRWTALAYLRPETAAAELARAALSPSSGRSPVLHAARIADALAAPLLAHENVLLYIAALESRARGDRRREERLFNLVGQDTELKIGGFTLPAPRDLPPLPNEGDESLPGEFVNSIGMRFVLVQPGKFLMGSPNDEEKRHEDEGPQHEVEITEPFYMGVFPVTQAEYEQVMGENPSDFKQVEGEDTRRFPVENVTWDQANEFCHRLSQISGETERTYRLPTEAEWEYTCRGGRCFSILPFHFQSPTSSLSSTQANFDGNFPYGGGDKGPYLKRPTPVGKYEPNALGIYDMHGNVWEWCADLFDTNYYTESPKRDPKGPKNGTSRVLRGGSFLSYGRYCRAAFRYVSLPVGRGNTVGFRVVLLPFARTP